MSQRTKSVAFGAGYITALAHVTGNDVRIKPANNPEACTVEVINVDGRVIARYNVLDMSDHSVLWVQMEDAASWPYAGMIVSACEDASKRWSRLDGPWWVFPHTSTPADHNPPALVRTRTRARTHSRKFFGTRTHAPKIHVERMFGTLFCTYTSNACSEHLFCTYTYADMSISRYRHMPI